MRETPMVERLGIAVAAVLLSTLTVGCLAGGEGGEDTVDPVEPRLELGSGSWRFEPLEHGQSVSMVRGAQGGWHVWLSVRALGFPADHGTLLLESQLADDSQPPQRIEVDVRLERPDSEGRRHYIGWPQVLAEPGCLVDQMLRVQATLVDTGGMELSSERYVTVLGGDDPPPACAL